MNKTDFIIILDNGTEVFVTEEVYHAYYRYKWREEKNSRRFYRHITSYNANRSASDENCTYENKIPSNVPTPEEAYLYKEGLEILDILTDEEKQIITSIYLNGMTTTACAAMLGKTRKYIRYHKTKALEKLKKSLEYT